MALRDAAALVFDSIAPADRHARPLQLPAHPSLARVKWIRLTPGAGPRNIYVFLAGLAMENILKADAVRLDGKAVSGGALSEAIRTHDLNRLAKLVGASPLTKAETKMLAIATEACISWGRYPGGVAHNKGYIAPPDDLDFDRFRRTFEALFDRIVDRVWPAVADDE
jgi:hypothetical protein